MRAVIQRVKRAEVLIESKTIRKISHGFVILVGIENSDNQEDVSWLARKIINLRVFDDDNGVMNNSLEEVGGELMIISQFTLHAKTKKGNRPSYIVAAKPEVAIPIYESFILLLKKLSSSKIVCGEFGAHMEVSLTNDGPVTLIIDTKNKE